MIKIVSSQLTILVLGIVLSANAYTQTCPGSPGCLDQSFGTAGVASYMVDPDLSALGPGGMAAQDDGKVLASVGGHKIVRMNADGSLDQTFGSGGVLSFVWAFTSGSTTY